MSTSFTELKTYIEGLGTGFEEFKKTNDERIEAIAKGNESLAGELDEKLGKIDVDLTKLADLKKKWEVEMEIQRDRLEELEARASKPQKSQIEKRHDEYKDTFLDWVRHKGQSPLHEQKMQDLHRKMVEEKAVTIATGAPGGFAVPEEIAREIERLELLFSPVRRLIKVITAGTSDYKELVNIRGAASGWVGESGSRTETATSSLREVTPTNGELYAYPQASEWSLDDIFFNVEAWLAEEVAQEFAVQEGQAVLTGNGTSKPTGMLNTTPVLTDDFASPLRAAAAYEYIASLSVTGSPLVAEIRPDSLIDLIYTLRSPYRVRGTFVMNSATTGAIRKLKDSQNQYLWQPGLVGGQPNMLLGFPIETWEDMANVATNAFPVAFGDFRRGYVLADRVGLRVTRDNVTNVGFVRFYIRRREGGIVLNNDAIKWLRTTVS